MYSPVRNHFPCNAQKCSGRASLSVSYTHLDVYKRQQHDYAAFADSQLKEREEAGFPPYTFQAMLRAESPHMADALAFLSLIHI